MADEGSPPPEGTEGDDEVVSTAASSPPSSNAKRIQRELQARAQGKGTSNASVAAPSQEGATATAPDDPSDETGVVAESDPETASRGAEEAPSDEQGAAPAPAPGSKPEQRPATETPPRGKQRSLVSKAIELPLLVLLAFVIAIIIKTFLVQAFYIPSGSMLPTLRVGDRVLVEKVGYVFGSPSRSDVVVFEKSVFGAPGADDGSWLDETRSFFRELLGLPTGTKEDYIKRIVAIGGDTVAYTGTPRKLRVNGREVDEPYIKGDRDAGSPSLTVSDCERLEMQEVSDGCRVPAGKVFVMGDNRSNSEDSRILGPVDEDKIVGRAFVIIWPFSDWGGL